MVRASAGGINLSEIQNIKTFNKCQFVIEAKSRDFFLGASSEEEMSTWMTELQRYVADLQDWEERMQEWKREAAGGAAGAAGAPRKPSAAALGTLPTVSESKVAGEPHEDDAVRADAPSKAATKPRPSASSAPKAASGRPAPKPALAKAAAAEGKRADTPTPTAAPAAASNGAALAGPADATDASATSALSDDDEPVPSQTIHRAAPIDDDVIDIDDLESIDDAPVASTAAQFIEQGDTDSPGVRSDRAIDSPSAPSPPPAGRGSSLAQLLSDDESGGDSDSDFDGGGKDDESQAQRATQRPMTFVVRGGASDFGPRETAAAEQPARPRRLTDFSDDSDCDDDVAAAPLPRASSGRPAPSLAKRPAGPRGAGPPILKVADPSRSFRSVKSVEPVEEKTAAPAVAADKGFLDEDWDESSDDEPSEGKTGGLRDASSRVNQVKDDEAGLASSFGSASSASICTPGMAKGRAPPARRRDGKHPSPATILAGGLRKADPSASFRKSAPHVSPTAAEREQPAVEADENWLDEDFDD